MVFFLFVLYFTSIYFTSIYDQYFISFPFPRQLILVLLVMKYNSSAFISTLDYRPFFALHFLCPLSTPSSFLRIKARGCLIFIVLRNFIKYIDVNENYFLIFFLNASFIVFSFLFSGLYKKKLVYDNSLFKVYIFTFGFF